MRPIQFFTIGILMLGSILAQSQPMEGMPSSKLVAAIDVEETIDGKAARSSTVELTFKPGQQSVPHRHPGPVYGYVMEGTFEFKVEGQPLQTLKPGEAFYEPRMILHEVSRNPSQTHYTKVLAIVVHPREAKQLMIPEKQ